MKIIATALNTLGNLADDLVTTKEELAKIELEKYKEDAKLAQGQIDINKIEAQHKSLFVSGWRPFIGWVCAFSFVYAFIIQPVLKFLVIIFDIAINEELPSVNIGEIMPVLLGMLGLGFARTYEKQKNVASDYIKPPKPKRRWLGKRK